MDTDDATGAATRVLRERPVEVLPPFVAEAATGVVVQTVVLATGAGVFLSLRGSGRIATAAERLSSIQDPTTAPEAVSAALSVLLTPAVSLLLAVGAAAAFAGAVLFRAAVGAAKVNAAGAAVGADARARASGAATAGDGETVSPLAAAVRGVFRDGGTFVGLTLLQFGVVLVPLTLATVGGAVGVLGAVLALPGLLFAYVGFLFAPEAVVVEGAGPLDAVGRNLGFLRRETGAAATYVALEVAALLGAALVGGLASTAGVGRVGNLLALFLVLPWLGLVRMGLFLPTGRERAARTAATGVAVASGTDDSGEATEWKYGPTADEAATPDADGAGTDDTVGTDPAAVGSGAGGAFSDLLGGFRAGLAALGRFLRDHPGLVAVAVALFGVGVVAGRTLGPRTAEPLTGDPSAVFGGFPLGTALTLTLNNWLVAVSETFGGVALGLPTVGNLLFNGLVVGALSGLFDPVVFAAFVLPHGIIEVPALAVGGAVGLHLARETVGLLRGRRSVEDVAEAVRQAFLVLLGLLPVFAVAGVVEAFLTPAVGGLVVGG